jgi:hypothetical protein
MILLKPDSAFCSIVDKPQAIVESAALRATLADKIVNGDVTLFRVFNASPE